MKLSALVATAAVAAAAAAVTVVAVTAAAITTAVMPAAHPNPALIIASLSKSFTVGVGKSGGFGPSPGLDGSGLLHGFTESRCRCSMSSKVASTTTRVAPPKPVPENPPRTPLKAPPCAGIEHRNSLERGECKLGAAVECVVDEGALPQGVITHQSASFIFVDLFMARTAQNPDKKITDANTAPKKIIDIST